MNEMRGFVEDLLVEPGMELFTPAPDAVFSHLQRSRSFNISLAALMSNPHNFSDLALSLKH